MAFGIGKAFKSIVGQLPGASSGALGAFGGIAESGEDMLRRRARPAFAPEPTQEEITTANVFAKLSPEQQKDILINNPNIVTALGEQRFDPLTNTIRLTESPFTKEQRLRQESLAKGLTEQLGGQLPSTDPKARFEEGRRLFQPEFQQQRERLEQQLADQGIPRGSEAYNEEINRLEQSQGRQLQELAFSSVQTAEAQRAARFNEISSLLGQQQVGGVGFGQFGAQFSGVDVSGQALSRELLTTQLGAQALEARRDRRSQREQAILGSLGQLGSAAIGLSDKRLKENIKLIGESKSGIPIYHFNYKYKEFGKDTYQGVMAQDIQKTHPEAVVNLDEGILAVDYSKIDVDFRRVNND